MKLTIKVKTENYDTVIGFLTGDFPGVKIVRGHEADNEVSFTATHDDLTEAKARKALGHLAIRISEAK